MIDMEEHFKYSQAATWITCFLLLCVILYLIVNCGSRFGRCRDSEGRLRSETQPLIVNDETESYASIQEAKDNHASYTFILSHDSQYQP